MGTPMGTDGDHFIASGAKGSMMEVGTFSAVNPSINLIVLKT